MHRGGSLCCRASTTTIAGELNLSNRAKMVKIDLPLPVEQPGGLFLSNFVFFLKFDKTPNPG